LGSALVSGVFVVFESQATSSARTKSRMAEKIIGTTARGGRIPGALSSPAPVLGRTKSRIFMTAFLL
jgi:hypothetical protein